MRYYKTNEAYVLRFDRGEEIVETLNAFCKDQELYLGSITAIGACDYMKVGLYNVGEKKYYSRVFEGPMEITSLVGNITNKNGDVYLHLHINACDEQMAIHGGHLNECRVSATCEMIITILHGEVGRQIDEETGLNVFNLG